MRNFQYQNLENYRRIPDTRLVISVSGGRSSAYQMAHIIEARKGKIPLDWVFAFENTGLEHEATYSFVWKLANYFSVNIKWLEFDPSTASQVREVDYWSAARNGEPMRDMLTQIMNRRDGTQGVRALPNPVQRTCTANLKTKTAHRYVRKFLGWPTNYHCAIGYRYDEEARVIRRRKLDSKSGGEGGSGIFPMYDNFVIKDDVDKFFLHGPFDLEIDSDFGNCDLCFMVSTWKIKQRMIHMALEENIKLRPSVNPPARVQRWIDWEERVSDRPGVFRRDRPNVRQLWEQVCQGNFESAVPEGKEDRCGSCAD